MKTVYATDLKQGSTICIEGEPCIVKSVDISKTGKHGASKCRIEAVGIFDSKKRIVVVPGSDRFEVPMIEKRKAQILAAEKEKKIASIMDLETFETFEIPIEKDLEIEEGNNVEYWQFGNKKIIKRIL
ncbi:MAG: translation initiation factor IF-5A [Candidatus Pacearchaeota archaeon]|nr:translation initiation factor IF-5A [Candidatus Pacearchaeota archaeon]